MRFQVLLAFEHALRCIALLLRFAYLGCSIIFNRFDLLSLLLEEFNRLGLLFFQLLIVFGFRVHFRLGFELRKDFVNHGVCRQDWDVVSMGNRYDLEHRGDTF